LVTDSSGRSYIKSPNAAIGNNVTVTIPRADTESLWATPMVAVVVGRSFFNANETQAADAIAGYTLLIDLCACEPDSGDDGVTGHKNIEARQFPGACPIGPMIVTRDEFDTAPGDAISVRINAVEVGSGSLWPARVDIGRLLAGLSQHYGFRPGDLVALEATGDGVGKPRKLLPGDRFSVACDGLMELDVTIA